LTDRMTRDRPRPADPDTETGRAALLAEVGRSVLRLLAELPTPPDRIRIRVRDIALELEWPAPDRRAPAQSPLAAAGGTTAAPAAGQPAPTGGGPPPGDHGVTAATVGTFYRAPEPGAPPFVEVGDPVQVGQQLAIVETMKMMIPVEADVNGRVREVLKRDGQSVEFGEALFLIERS
jgi:acetyl-CoA carboxylase biotin carboxyl carrier protein